MFVKLPQFVWVCAANFLVSKKPQKFWSAENKVIIPAGATTFLQLDLVPRTQVQDLWVAFRHLKGPPEHKDGSTGTGFAPAAATIPRWGTRVT